MSTSDFDLALQLMAQYPDEKDFVGTRSEALINMAEVYLGLHFSASYRRFLQELGAGGFGGFEVYGLIDSNFIESMGPDGIWVTAQMRKKAALPASMVVIGSDEMGGLYCLDCSNALQAEPPVIIFEPGFPVAQQTWEVIAPNFESFFLKQIEQTIAWLNR